MSSPMEFSCLGYALRNWTDFAFTFLPEDNTGRWRAPLAVPFFPSLVNLFSVFLLPESPHWLVWVSRIEEAFANLAAYKGTTAGDEMIKTEIAGIELSLEATAKSKSVAKEKFSKDDEEHLLYRFSLCIVLQFFQQMCGGNPISVMLAACALTRKFLCSFIAFFAIDRLGRRAVFMISGTSMCICMLALAVTNSFGSDNKHATIASAIFIFVFNCFYPIGFLGGNFLYCTEVAPVKLRVAVDMSSVSTANHWLWNFVVCCLHASPVLVYFFYPETMNRNLELLNHVFRDVSSPWQIVSMARHLPQGEVTTEEFITANKDKGDGCSVEVEENA